MLHKLNWNRIKQRRNENFNYLIFNMYQFILALPAKCAVRKVSRKLCPAKFSSNFPTFLFPPGYFGIYAPSPVNNRWGLNN